MHRVNIPMSRVSIFRGTLERFFPAVWAVIFAGAGLLAPAAGQDRTVTFDIPAQPLAQALDAYGRTTGMAALVDQSLTAGRRSAGVKGVLTPDQALKVLVAGTGLAIRYAGSDAFTLEPASTVVTLASSDVASVRGPEDGAYFADLQDTLIRTLCRRLETRPGRYRLGVQLWIGSGGVIRAAHLLDSSGSPDRDVAITDVLSDAVVASPPPALPQPVTIVLLPRRAGEAPDCRQDERRSE